MLGSCYNAPLDGLTFSFAPTYADTREEWALQSGIARMCGYLVQCFMHMLALQNPSQPPLVKGKRRIPPFERGQEGFFQGIILKPGLQNTSPYLRICVLGLREL
jgi:hypothetical protein